MELTLGPIPFHWPAERRRDFYARIADEAPVDTVYLGEVICSKRAPFHEHDLGDTAARLERAGKRVVFSTLCEVMTKRERKMTEELCAMEGAEIEVNNATALWHIAGRGHRLGPLMNVYNEATLAYLAARGATHVSLPVELPGAAVAQLGAAARSLGIGVEVQVFGRASLAVSARCYHARAHGRTKDSCQFVCEADPDGMALKTLDGKDFLTVNGIQTLSQSYISLISDLPALRAAGVSHCRLVPHSQDMVAVARLFRAAMAGGIGPGEAAAALSLLGIPAPFSNGFWHGQPGYKMVPAAAMAG